MNAEVCVVCDGDRAADEGLSLAATAERGDIKTSAVMGRWDTVCAAEEDGRCDGRLSID